MWRRDGRGKMVSRLCVGIGLGLVGCGGGVQAAEFADVSQSPEGFWDHWGDGQAEIAGYALTQPRYGQLRNGRAVHISVTEDFTRKTRVKSDGGHGEEVPVDRGSPAFESDSMCTLFGFELGSDASVIERIRRRFHKKL